MTKEKQKQNKIAATLVGRGGKLLETNINVNLEIEISPLICFKTKNRIVVFFQVIV